MLVAPRLIMSSGNGLIAAGIATVSVNEPYGEPAGGRERRDWMTIEEILKAKGNKVYTVEADATLEHVASRLVDHNVGSLVVCARDAEHGERVIGIITERDILHVCASRGQRQLASMRVHEAMSTDLATASPAEQVETIMGLMTSRRIRHLPVLREGRLVGLVSIGDVVKAQHDRLALENKFMKDYIQREGVTNVE